jgi:hypothetical protein
MSEEIKIDTADSLLGKLQRGRGAGFLAARQETPSTIWPLLVECITHDPRLDKQIESRDDFYASLTIETGMKLDPLSTHLREQDDKESSDWNTPLTISTLGSLAKRNYQDAVDILRDYIVWGKSWSCAIYELALTKNPKAWVKLDGILCKRLGSDESAKEELWWLDAKEEPWKTWCEQNSQLHQLADCLPLPPKPMEDLDYDSMTVTDILRLAGEDGPERLKLRKAVVNTVKPDDFDFLLSQVSINDPKRSAIALAGLTKLANPAMFDWLRDFWSHNPKMPGMLRGTIAKAMASLPATQTLPLARDWLNHDNWHFRLLAERLMKQHATFDDVPRLRQEITKALADSDNRVYRLCSLVEAFKHLPGIGRISELESVFVELLYSYGRSRVAEALLAVDRDFFVRTYAQECLWDCEDRTRVLGCEAVDLTDKVTAGRIKQLSTDIWEDELVRNAAAKRS